MQQESIPGRVSWSTLTSAIRNPPFGPSSEGSGGGDLCFSEIFRRAVAAVVSLFAGPLHEDFFVGLDQLPPAADFQLLLGLTLTQPIEILPLEQVLSGQRRV